MARELARLDINIADLKEGPLREDGAVYILFWSEKNNHERRLSGVSFMIKTFIAELANRSFRPTHVPKTPT